VAHDFKLGQHPIGKSDLFQKKLDDFSTVNQCFVSRHVFLPLPSNKMAKWHSNGKTGLGLPASGSGSRADKG
jgi:hypothetical protein